MDTLHVVCNLSHGMDRTLKLVDHSAACTFYYKYMNSFNGEVLDFKTVSHNYIKYTIYIGYSKHCRSKARSRTCVQYKAAWLATSIFEAEGQLFEN